MENIRKPNQEARPLRVLMAGSGTAGPVIPLVAIVQELRARHITFEALFLGTASGPEQEIVEKAQIPFKVFPAGKLRRYVSLKTIPDGFRVVWAFFRALGLIARWDPDVFVSAGGFIAPPVAWACWLLGVPVLLHQQDAVPILSDKLMMRIASRITVTFEASLERFPAHKTVWTGNPVRADLAQGDSVRGRKRFEFGLAKPTILCMGGGTGAQALNDAVLAALPELLPTTNVLHLTGKGKLPERDLESLQVEGVDVSGYRAYEFLHEEMADAYALAEVVVARGGFSTLTELAFLQKPAIIVPLPDSPQERNAEVFEQRGAVRVLAQNNLTARSLSAAVLSLLGDEGGKSELSHRIGKSMKSGATGALVDEVLALASR